MLKSKRLKCFISLILLNAINPTFSASGEFFVIRQDCHIQDTYEVSLCLDSSGPLTCQVFPVQATMLTISTKVPYQVYENAGIKTSSARYIPTQCTPSPNGYCRFQVSDTLPHTIVMNPGAGLFFIC